MGQRWLWVTMSRAGSPRAGSTGSRAGCVLPVLTARDVGLCSASQAGPGPARAAPAPLWGARLGTPLSHPCHSYSTGNTVQGGSRFAHALVSAYGGVLSNFSGTVKYSGSSYPFPTTSETPRVVYNSRTDKPWPVALYLTPVSSAGGVAIKAGSLIAVLILRQTNNYNSDDFQFVWNIYANNDVVVPTGGCDVSARDVTVTLPDYPGSVPIPLTVYCAKSQNLGYYLSGTTADAGNSIFTNTASFSPAQGVGVQLTRNGTIIPANNTVSLGAVGTSAVSLGLTANYARTGGQVTAGNVKSIIGVTFVYQ